MDEDLCRHCHMPLPDAGPCRRCGRTFVELATGSLADEGDRLWLIVRTVQASYVVCIPKAAWDGQVPVIDIAPWE